MSVKVIDLNEETKELPAIEETKGAEYDDDDGEEIQNEVVQTNEEQSNQEEPKEQPKEEEPTKPKPKAKPKPNDLVFCPDCSRQMTYKNLRYSHKCSPEPPPVKKQAKPKAKTKTKATIQQKPATEVYYSESEEEDRPLSKPVKNQILKPRSAGAQGVPPQPTNPVNAFYQHYQLLQEQMLQKKTRKI